MIAAQPGSPALTKIFQSAAIINRTTASHTRPSAPKTPAAAALPAAFPESDCCIIKNARVLIKRFSFFCGWDCLNCVELHYDTRRAAPRKLIRSSFPQSAGDRIVSFLVRGCFERAPLECVPAVAPFFRQKWIRKDFPSLKRANDGADEHQQHPDDDRDPDHLRVSVDQMRKPAVVEKHVNYAIPSRA